MVVIYTQDNTIMRKSADSALPDLISLYGEKLGKEAFIAINGKPVGTSYRKCGGPLVKIVSITDAEAIADKETAIGMLSRVDL